MELLPFVRLSHWTCGMHYGCCRFQGEMVCVILGSYAQYLQRLHQQLVEYPQCTPTEGFLEVSIPQCHSLHI